MNINTEQMQELIANQMPSILEGMKKELRETLTTQAVRCATDLVSKATAEWMNENLVPEIHRQLVESKDGLLVVAEEFGKELTIQLTEALSGSLKKRLESSWERKKIFSALFGD